MLKGQSHYKHCKISRGNPNNSFYGRIIMQVNGDGNRFESARWNLSALPACRFLFSCQQKEKQLKTVEGFHLDEFHGFPLSFQ